MKRNPFDAAEVTSRRGGPVKAPLSRYAIVSEALRQLTSHGLDGMSLRKVAAALDTGPASLYAYVDDLDELYALVLDRALEKVDTRARTKDGWRARLVALLESYARVLSASPGLAQLAFGRVAIGPNALRIIEALLQLLAAGGVERSTAAWAVDLLLLYVTAIVAEHSQGSHRTAPAPALGQAIFAASQSQYPELYAARDHLLSGTPDARFGWAIDVLLRGILASPPPATAGTSSGAARPRRAGKPRRAAR